MIEISPSLPSEWCGKPTPIAEYGELGVVSESPVGFASFGSSQVCGWPFKRAVSSPSLTSQSGSLPSRR